MLSKFVSLINAAGSAATAKIIHMGIPERKEKQKLEIKKQILEASMKLFVEEGFGNVTIRRIADLIEYSPTTVYLYF